MLNTTYFHYFITYKFLKLSSIYRSVQKCKLAEFLKLVYIHCGKIPHPPISVMKPFPKEGKRGKLA